MRTPCHIATLCVLITTTALAADAPATAPVAAAKPYLTVDALRAKWGDRRARIAVIGGVEVYYKDEGRGPAILMVHGSQSTLKTWDRVAPVLTSRYRVIRYDIPPQGLSGTVTDEQAAKLVPVDIAEGLLAKLGVTRVTVVGVSSGGTLGVFLAAKRPDMVERLIVSNMPSDPVSSGHMNQSAEFLDAQREAKETGFQNQRFWNAFLDFFAGDPKRLDAGVREQYYDVNRRVPEKHYLSLVAQVANQEKAIEAMSRVSAPTLLIWGARDALLVPASADRLAQRLTKAQVSKVLLPDVGHYPPLEAPERFGKLIAAYIEAATPAAAASAPASGRRD
jgi:pimeloyl-ACP methyl ester carboxylesterase